MRKISMICGKRTLMVFGILIVMLAFSVGTVSAVYGDDGDGVIEANEVIDDDVFIAQDNVVVDGTVEGSLFATGNNITINGTIGNDLFVAGQVITISDSAKINGNIYLAGRSLMVDAKIDGSVFGGCSDFVLGDHAVVERNLYVGGYSLETRNGSKINTDINFGGYQAILGGTVGRDVSVGSEALDIDGQIGRNVYAEVGSAEMGESFVSPMSFYQYQGLPPAKQPGIRVSDDAKVGGQFTYVSKNPQDSSIKSEPVGGIVYRTPVPVQETGVSEETDNVDVHRESGVNVFSALKRILGIIRNYISLLILGALAIWLLPLHFNNIVAIARKDLLPATGWGLVVVIIGYVGAAIAAGLILMLALFFLLVTLGGLSGTVFGIGFSALGLALAVFTLLVTYGSKLVIAYLLGSLIFTNLNTTVNMKKALALIVGLLIYVLVAAIPCVGWLVKVVVTFMGMGAMWMYFQQKRSNRVVRDEASLPTSTDTADEISE